MTLSQEIPMCTKKDLDAITPVEYNGDYRAHPVHYSIDQYGRQYQIPHHNLPPAYREAPPIHHYSTQAMSYENMILQSHLYNYQANLHMGHGGGANFAPSNGMQLPATISEQQMNAVSTWQGDWAASAYVHQTYSTPMTDRQVAPHQNFPVELMEQPQTHRQVDGTALVPTPDQQPFSSSDSTVKTEVATFVATDSTAETSLNEESVLPAQADEATTKSNGDEEAVEPTGLVGAQASTRESTEEPNTSIDTTATHSVPTPPEASQNSPAIHAPRSQREVSAINAVFSLGSDSSTNELGWFIQYQSSPFQSSPCLNSRTAFAIRPLGPGILAGIHNEWLNEFPEPAEEVLKDNASSSSVNQGFKRFPTPSLTFESQHVRSLWQELERRRILEINHDPVQIQRVRNEAFTMLQKEALQRQIGMKSRTGSKGHQDELSEISEEDIDERALLLWEQSKKSAAYAVGLLRQAEYCIAQGHLGFVPLQQSQMIPVPAQVPIKSASVKKEEKKNSRKRSHRVVKQEDNDADYEPPVKRRGRTKGT